MNTNIIANKDNNFSKNILNETLNKGNMYEADGSSSRKSQQQLKKRVHSLHVCFHQHWCFGPKKSNTTTLLTKTRDKTESIHKGIILGRVTNNK